MSRKKNSLSSTPVPVTPDFDMKSIIEEHENKLFIEKQINNLSNYHKNEIQLISKMFQITNFCKVKSLYYITVKFRAKVMEESFEAIIILNNMGDSRMISMGISTDTFYPTFNVTISEWLYKLQMDIKEDDIRAASPVA
jgi:hypothetical protein